MRQTEKSDLGGDEVDDRLELSAKTDKPVVGDGDENRSPLSFRELTRGLSPQERGFCAARGGD
jgi:hypothetical protein